jgi:hypothetical protein
MWGTTSRANPQRLAIPKRALVDADFVATSLAAGLSLVTTVVVSFYLSLLIVHMGCW